MVPDADPEEPTPALLKCRANGFGGFEFTSGITLGGKGWSHTKRGIGQGETAMPLSTGLVTGHTFFF